MNKNLTRESKKMLKELYHEQTKKLKDPSLTEEEKEKIKADMAFIKDQLGYKPIGASDILNVVIAIGTTLLSVGGSFLAAGVSQHWANKGTYNKYSEMFLNETAKNGIRVKK